MKREGTKLYTGMKLLPDSLPVPTKNNEKKIHIIENSKRFLVTKESEFTIAVNKSTFSEKDDRDVPRIVYNTEEYIRNNYCLRYMDGETKYPFIGYEQMNYLEAHTLVEDGIYFVQNGNVYFLCEEDRTFYFIAKEPGIVTKIAFSDEGDLVFDKITNYEKFVSNQWQERMSGDFTGYVDKYQLNIKKLKIEKAVLVNLIYKEKKKIYRNIKQENESCWTKMYGDGHYKEYRGDIFCLIPLGNILNWDSLIDESMRFENAKDWVLVKFEPESGKQKILKFFKNGQNYSFCKEVGIPFSIFEDKIYYYVDVEDADFNWCTKIISYDINTGYENETIVKHENVENMMVGIFKSSENIVIVTKEYDDYMKKEITYIETLGKKDRTVFGGNIDIEGYNEQYIFYKEYKKLYVINTTTYEVTNLNDKLTNLVDSNFYGVDVRKNLIYVTARMGEHKKMMVINLDDEVVSEINLPEIPECLKNIHPFELKKLKGNEWKSGIFFNGTNWVVRLVPEDAEYNSDVGDVVFDKEGNIIGNFLKKNENKYISRYEMRFFLPSAVLFGYDLVDKNKISVSFDTLFEGELYWVSKLFYVKESTLKDSGIMFYH